MPALLSWTNWLDRAEASLTASSQAAPQLVTRLAEPPVKRRWRTVAGVTSPVLDVDLGRVREVGILALVQPDDCGGIDGNGEPRGWMQSSDTVRHRLDATTAGAGALLDTGAQPGGWVPGYGVHVHRLATAVSAQYWRCNIAAPSLATVPGYLDLGRAWIGPAWTPSRGNFAYGWGRVWQDESEVSTNRRSGLDFVDVMPQRRALTFAFNALTQSDAAQIDELQRVAGRRGQVLFHPFEDSRIPAVLGRLVEVQPITQPNFAMFQVAFQIRQSL